MDSVPTESPSKDGYVLDRNEREYRRLSTQAGIWAMATRRAIAQIPLPAGAKVLDVGCGTGEAMELIADYLDASGQITGMDIDAELARGPLSRLLRSNPTRFRFAHGDVTQASTLEAAPFDLVFARLLLFHMRQPVQVLARLWDWVRPGGVLMVIDYDITTTRSYPQGPALERAARLINHAFRRTGRDIEIGTRMPELFMQARIGTADACEVSSVVLPAEPSARMMREVLASLRTTILAFQIAEPAVLDRLEDELRAAESTRAVMRWPDLVVTWKRKAG